MRVSDVSRVFIYLIQKLIPWSTSNLTDIVSVTYFKKSFTPSRLFSSLGRRSVKFTGAGTLNNPSNSHKKSHVTLPVALRETKIHPAPNESQIYSQYPKRIKKYFL